MANAEELDEYASYSSDVPEWFSATQSLEAQSAVHVSERVALNLNRDFPREILKSKIWERPYWINEKQGVEFLPKNLRALLLSITRSFMRKTESANRREADGQSLFSCWWIFFNESSDNSIDLKNFDYFGARFLIELIDYLGSVCTKVESISLSCNGVKHLAFQRMIQKQPQIKNITFYQTIKPEVLMSIAEGLELESVTFHPSCINHCTSKDMTKFLTLQQKTLKTFRWQCIFPLDSFPKRGNPEFLLKNLQVLEINANDLCNVPHDACKTIVKLAVNVLRPFKTPTTDRRMSSLKELKIMLHSDDSTVNLAFCSIFENQTDIGPLSVEIISRHVEMPEFILSHIPNVQAASINVIPKDPYPMLPAHMPLLKKLKGPCTIGLFESLQNCPNLERLELKILDIPSAELCIKELTKINKEERKFNIQYVDVRFDLSFPSVSKDYLLMIFTQFKDCCPFLKLYTSEKLTTTRNLSRKYGAYLIGKLSALNFSVELTRTSMLEVRPLEKSTLIGLPVRFSFRSRLN